MAQYPKKQIGQFRGPGWYTHPPAAGGYLPGAGAELSAQAEGFAGLSESLAGYGAEIGKEVTKENIQKAQNFVTENEKEFRRLEKAGELDWTPPMMQGAWITSGILAGRDFNTEYEERMSTLSTEELQDIDAPQRIHQEMLDEHQTTDTRRNTWFDDGFNSQAIDKGKARVAEWTVTAAKERKSQALHDIGIETGNIVLEGLSILKGMDPRTKEYREEKAKAIKSIADTLNEKMNGSSDSTDSGAPNTGWYGKGLLTADNNLGSQLIIKSILNQLSTGVFDPEIGTEILDKLKGGTGKLIDIEENRLLIEQKTTDLTQATNTWDATQNANFYNILDTSINNDPSLYSAQHRNRQSTQDKAIADLENWYATTRKKLIEHFGLTYEVDADGKPTVPWPRDDETIYNSYQLKIENTYISTRNKINTQQQISQVVLPTMADIEASVSRTLGGAHSVIGRLFHGTDAGDSEFGGEHAGIIAGATGGHGNPVTLIETATEILAEYIDPDTITLDKPDGTKFGPTKARRYIEKEIYNTLILPHITNWTPTSADVIAGITLKLGLQNSTIQGLLGAAIERDAEALLHLGATGPGGTPQGARAVGERTWETGFADLPRDVYEISVDDIPETLVRSYHIYEKIRVKGVSGAEVLGIKDTPIADIFEDAYSIRDNNTPVAARLVNALRQRLPDVLLRGDVSELSAADRDAIIKSLSGRNLDLHEDVVPGIMDDPVVSGVRLVSPLLQTIETVGDFFDSDAQKPDAYLFDIIGPFLADAYGKFSGSTSQKREQTITWAEDNIVNKKGVFLRLGPQNSLFMNIDPDDMTRGPEEADFYTRMAEDLTELAGIPENQGHVELVVMTVGDKTVVIPNLVAPNGVRRDLIGTNIKAVYSDDDLQYMYEEYKEADGKVRHNEYERSKGLGERAGDAFGTFMHWWKKVNIDKYPERFFGAPFGGGLMTELGGHAVVTAIESVMDSARNMEPDADTTTEPADEPIVDTEPTTVPDPDTTTEPDPDTTPDEQEEHYRLLRKEFEETPHIRKMSIEQAQEMVDYAKRDLETQRDPSMIPQLRAAVDAWSDAIKEGFFDGNTGTEVDVEPEEIPEYESWEDLRAAIEAGLRKGSIPLSRVGGVLYKWNTHEGTFEPVVEPDTEPSDHKSHVQIEVDKLSPEEQVEWFITTEVDRWVRVSQGQPDWPDDGTVKHLRDYLEEVLAAQDPPIAAEDLRDEIIKRFDAYTEDNK